MKKTGNDKGKNKLNGPRFRVSWYVQVEGVAEPDKGAADHNYFSDARKHYKKLCYQHFTIPNLVILHLRLNRIGKGRMPITMRGAIYEYSQGVLPPEEQTRLNPPEVVLLHMSVT